MAAFGNPQVKAFLGERARPTANAMMQTYWAAKRLLAEWHARGIAGLMAGAASDDVIADGAAQDGRTPVTVAELTNLVSNAEWLVTQMEASGNARLNVFTRPSVVRD